MSVLSFEISFLHFDPFVLIFHFRFRAIKWIGVPSKTKALRIWFSKKNGGMRSAPSSSRPQSWRLGYSSVSHRRSWDVFFVGRRWLMAMASIVQDSWRNPYFDSHWSVWSFLAILVQALFAKADKNNRHKKGIGIDRECHLPHCFMVWLFFQW